MTCSICGQKDELLCALKATVILECAGGKETFVGKPLSVCKACWSSTQVHEFVFSSELASTEKELYATPKK